MKRHTPYALAGIVCAALATSGAVRWRASAFEAERSTTAVAAISGSLSAPNDSVLAASEDDIVSANPFRLSNAPASVRFNPASDGMGIPGAPPPLVIRPVLTLKAIVGGPPWQAIVDGIPGQPPGTIVRAGATFDKLTARAVTRDSVIIQGPDTSWVLSFRRTP